MQMALFLIACLVGQVMQTATGFGFAIIVMAVASSFFPVTVLSAACSLLSLGSCAYLAVRYRKRARLRAILWPLAGMLIFSSLAIWITRFLTVQTLKGFLGLALIGLSVFFLAFSRRIRIRPSRTGGFLAGGCSGLLSGFFSTGGPPMVVYLLSALDDKDEYLASVQTVFFFSNLWTTANRAAAGFLTREVAVMSLLGYVCVAAGIFIGTRLIRRLNIDRLRKVAYVFIGVSGAWISVSAWLL